MDDANDPELQADLAFFGIDPPAPKRAPVLDVWPENVEAVELFFAVQTQWRLVAGFGTVIYHGLDYTAVEAAMRMRRTRDRARLFAQLQVMEAAAMSVLNRRARER